MNYSDNPIQDFLNYDAKQCTELEKMPKCDYCSEAIQDEYLYIINNKFVCEQCMCEFHRRWTEDYIE